MDIGVSCIMENILKIDEIDEVIFFVFVILDNIAVIVFQVFYVSFNLRTQWYDSRLVYRDLKRKADLNVLTPDQMVRCSFGSLDS